MQREKLRVALISLLGAILLTSTKFWIALATGSLGILAEAVHSCLDMLASLLTLGAVRYADRPPDRSHPYGHGRIENLAAAVQAGLLLVLVGWVAWESILRLFVSFTPIEVNLWSFVVMAGSIVVDYSRSTALQRAAKKYRSQALEADALNFRSDMWSSATVLIGLCMVVIAQRFPQWSWLERSDALAALIVSVIIIIVALRLGIKALHVLLDRAPEGLTTDIRQAAAEVPGVLSVDNVRVRESGSRTLADLTISVSRDASLAQAHLIAKEVEKAVGFVRSGTDVVVHVEPLARADEPVLDGVRAVALKLGLRTHDEQVHRVDGRLVISLDLELDAELDLEEAHAVADRLEDALKREYPTVRDVVIHLEPAADEVGVSRDVTLQEQEWVRLIRHMAEQAAVGAKCSEIKLFRTDRRQDVLSNDEGVRQKRYEYDVALRCHFQASNSLEQTHQLTEKVEQALRSRFPSLARIVVHAEPEERNPE